MRPDSTQRMRALVETYVAGLAARRQVLAVAYKEMTAALAKGSVDGRCNVLSLESLMAFRSEVHKLAGSAGSMTLDDLGRAAGALDVYLSAVQARTVNDRDLAQLSFLYDRLDDRLATQRGGTDPLVSALGGEDPQCPPPQRSSDASVILAVGEWSKAITDICHKVRPFGWTLEPCSLKDLQERLCAPTIPSVGVVMADSSLAGRASRCVDGQVPLVAVGRQGEMAERLELVRCGVRVIVETPGDVLDVIDAIERVNGPPETLTSSQSMPIKVILVENDGALSTLLTYQLTMAGMDVTCLDSAETVLSVLAAVQPDVLVLDQAMDGFSVACVIRQDFDAIPLVFLGADRRAMSDDYLHKPVDGEHLVSLVRARALGARVLRRKSMTDGVSGLLNRTAFMDEAQRQVALARRMGRPLSLAVLAVDHFTMINDTQGYHAGDIVLRGVSHVLRQRILRPDSVGRWGDGAFAVVMPEIPLGRARKSMEALCDDISQVAYAGAGGDFRATVRAGVANDETGAQTENDRRTVEELLRAAIEDLATPKK